MHLVDLKGVGNSYLKKLEKLEIFSIEDLLYHFPTRYVDRREKKTIEEVKELEDDNYHCKAKVAKVSQFTTKSRKPIAIVQFIDDTGKMTATWFNNTYIVGKIQKDDTVVFSGKPDKSKIFNPKVMKVNSDKDIQFFARMEPVYRETLGLKSYQINIYIRQVLQTLLQYKKVSHEASRVDPSLEVLLKHKLPEGIVKNEGFVERYKAFRYIHFPKNPEEIQKSREYFAFEEIYRIVRDVKRRKENVEGFTSYPMSINEPLYRKIIKSLKFNLTESQNKAIKDIFADIQASKPMHRLINGDVGSGKTIVAFCAAAQAARNGYQAIILAPTSVLAMQHYNLFNNLFSKTGINVHLVTSDTRAEINKLKKDTLFTESKADVFIGTHALFYHTDIFENLGLVVIDEQHKFGVKQREVLQDPKKLFEKFNTSKDGIRVPHILSMSATPIPRTLALTLFGDIDVSFLEKPVERKKIITKFIGDDDLVEKMYEWIRKEINESKSQVYVVCPLIEESEKIDVKAALQEYEFLQSKYKEFKVDVLYGRLKPAEKDMVINDFKEGRTQMLVTTSVVEVGVDNPNATIMIIEGAERFGLSQLHQIRGRVGRDQTQSYCFIKTSDNNLNDRIKFFCDNNDGFKIAEFDLGSRGPGEVYGDIQSGMPDLKVADIMDLELIKRVKKWV